MHPHNLPLSRFPIKNPRLENISGVLLLNPCSLCPAHCCKSYIITVTIYDVMRISKNTGQNPEEFCALSELRMLSYDPDVVLDTTDGYGYYVLALKSHPCIFLGKDNRCKIHEFSPMSCRRYPYTISDKLNTRFCPLPSQLLFRLRGPDIKITPLSRELDAHKELVSKWNKKPGKKADCLGFLLKNAKDIS